jgi:hypothetical protein
MAPLGRTTITCECGRKLEVDIPPESKTLTVFCEGCYLNMVLESTGQGHRTLLRYYFPDD